MRRTSLAAPAGVRWIPERHSGAGVLVLAGSRGLADESRARLLAEQGAVAKSIQWFGGPGQNAGPWEIPVETFQTRVSKLAADCDRIVVIGLSFGAEGALVAAAHTPRVSAVVAFSPSDVVWAGVPPDGRQTSHWTLDETPVPFVPFAQDWRADSDPPSYRSLYLRSRELDPAAVDAATIAVERIPAVVLVAGGDDRVWPADLHAELIARRRARHGLPTTVITEAEAGHRAILPGEPVVTAGLRMQRGGTDAANRRLGASAWDAILGLLAA
jgi:dienelactone hydrolase